MTHHEYCIREPDWPMSTMKSTGSCEVCAEAVECWNRTSNSEDSKAHKPVHIDTIKRDSDAG